MKIREAKTSDMENLLEMGEKFFDQTRQKEMGIQFDRQSVQILATEMIEKDLGVIFLAMTDDGSPVGVAGGILFPLWMNPNHLTGQEMFWYVDPNHRKSRAGRLLFNALEKWAQDKGANSFSMVALSHMHENRVGQMYESKGYVPMEKTYIKEF